jgi:hypothetical protein
MRLALIITCVFFISNTGLAEQNAVADDILYNQLNSLSGWGTPQFFNNECRNTQQTAIDGHSSTANGYLFDDCLFITQPEKALLTYDQGGTKRLDDFDDKWTKLAGKGYHSMYTRAEISAIDSGRDGKLANNPSPSNNYYDKIVSWIEDKYHAWVAKDHYGSTRLLLLSFGLVGLIGIRRKFKKN